MVVAAALVALAGLGSLGWSRSHVVVQPAGTETPLGMPDQIWLADEHLQGTDDTGPIGPLVAVVPTVRDTWFGRPDNGVLGISATGEYAFLDLAHGIDSSIGQPAVSADGRYVAYWRSGTPSGTPGNLAMAEEGVGVGVGVGVYDTVTGKTYERLVETEHGLQPENLLWAGDRVWFDVWQMDAPSGDGGQSSSLTEIVSWDPVRDVVQYADRRIDLSRATAWDGSVVTSRENKLLRSGPTSTETIGVLDSEVFDFQSPLFVSPDGTRVAAPQAPWGGDPVPLLVGTLGPAAGTVTLDEVPSVSVTFQGSLLGWRDPDHVVVADYGAGTGEATYEAIEVATGDAEILGYAEGNPPIFAAEALTGPVFEAPEPPAPRNPFLVYGGGAAILLAAGLALRWWRRRVQR